MASPLPSRLLSLAGYVVTGRFLRFLLRFVGLVERLLVIMREQHGQLVGVYLVTIETVDKLVHLAVKEYLERFGTPNITTQCRHIWRSS